jgi:hypothetical protein
MMSQWQTHLLHKTTCKTTCRKQVLKVEDKDRLARPYEEILTDMEARLLAVGYLEDEVAYEMKAARREYARSEEIIRDLEDVGMLGYTTMKNNKTPAEEIPTFIPFERIRRITGYLVGTVDRFNDAKAAEVGDRVKHGTSLEEDGESAIKLSRAGDGRVKNDKNKVLVVR